ncbi:MAG: hypothetical protein ACOY31_00355 [Bacillota bacterium]
MGHSCGNCSRCESDFRAPEYINAEGYTVVQCPACETEITTGKTTDKSVMCEECGTVIEIVPVLFN